jgi:Nitrous oxide-stimulated promoter
MAIMDQELAKDQVSDLKVLVRFIGIYCNARHGEGFREVVKLPFCLGKPVLLCPECSSLVGYSIHKRRLCPLDPKPSCRKCPIHCYNLESRARIREIMAFSGRRMILRGRLDYIWHYLF